MQSHRFRHLNAQTLVGILLSSTATPSSSAAFPVLLPSRRHGSQRIRNLHRFKPQPPKPTPAYELPEASAPGQRPWQLIDTSFVEMPDVKLDDEAAHLKATRGEGERSWAAAVAASSDADMPSISEVRDEMLSFIQACERYMAEDDTYHKSFSRITERNTGPQYEDTDRDLKLRNAWFAMRNRFLETVPIIIDAINLTAANQLLGDPSSSSASASSQATASATGISHPSYLTTAAAVDHTVDLVLCLNLMSLFDACRRKALKFAGWKEWDPRPASDYAPVPMIDLCGIVMDALNERAPDVLTVLDSVSSMTHRRRGDNTASSSSSDDVYRRLLHGLSIAEKASSSSSNVTPRAKLVNRLAELTTFALAATEVMPTSLPKHLADALTVTPAENAETRSAAGRPEGESPVSSFESASDYWSTNKVPPPGQWLLTLANQSELSSRAAWTLGVRLFLKFPDVASSSSSFCEEFVSAVCRAVLRGGLDNADADDACDVLEFARLSLAATANQVHEHGANAVAKKAVTKNANSKHASSKKTQKNSTKHEATPRSAAATRNDDYDDGDQRKQQQLLDLILSIQRRAVHRFEMITFNPGPLTEMGQRRALSVTADDPHHPLKVLRAARQEQSLVIPHHRLYLSSLEGLRDAAAQPLATARFFKLQGELQRLIQARREALGVSSSSSHGTGGSVGGSSTTAMPLQLELLRRLAGQLRSETVGDQTASMTLVMTVVRAILPGLRELHTANENGATDMGEINASSSSSSLILVKSGASVDTRLGVDYAARDPFSSDQGRLRPTPTDTAAALRDIVRSIDSAVGKRASILSKSLQDVADLIEVFARLGHEATSLRTLLHVATTAFDRLTPEQWISLMRSRRLMLQRRQSDFGGGVGGSMQRMEALEHSMRQRVVGWAHRALETGDTTTTMMVAERGGQRDTTALSDGLTVDQVLLGLLGAHPLALEPALADRICERLLRAVVSDQTLTPPSDVLQAVQSYLSEHAGIYHKARSNTSSHLLKTAELLTALIERLLPLPSGNHNDRANSAEKTKKIVGDKNRNRINSSSSSSGVLGVDVHRLLIVTRVIVDFCVVSGSGGDNASSSSSSRVITAGLWAPVLRRCLILRHRVPLAPLEEQSAVVAALLRAPAELLEAAPPAVAKGLTAVLVSAAKALEPQLRVAPHTGGIAKRRSEETEQRLRRAAEIVYRSWPMAETQGDSDGGAPPVVIAAKKRLAML